MAVLDIPQIVFFFAIVREVVFLLSYILIQWSLAGDYVPCMGMVSKILCALFNNLNEYLNLGMCLC